MAEPNPTVVEVVRFEDLPPGSLAKLRAAGVFQNILGTDSHPGSQQLADVPGAIVSVAETMVRALERR